MKGLTLENLREAPRGLFGLVGDGDTPRTLVIKTTTEQRLQVGESFTDDYGTTITIDSVHPEDAKGGSTGIRIQPATATASGIEGWLSVLEMYILTN